MDEVKAQLVKDVAELKQRVAALGDAHASLKQACAELVREIANPHLTEELVRVITKEELEAAKPPVVEDATPPTFAPRKRPFGLK